MAKIPSYLLNLTGEYRVCSELTKRGVFATVTFGNHKGVDVYAISDRKDLALKIEVKTSQTLNFVTSITQKGLADSPHAPDFWVLFQTKLDKYAQFSERFFILSHKEICRIQAKRNRKYAVKYFERHGKGPDAMKGVDNVTIKDVERFEDRWDRIIVRFGVAATG